MRYKIIISYNGGSFSGWQVQPRKLTVQGTVEDALLRVYGERVSIVGSGRTDEGVHALGQAAHFDVPHEKIGPEKLVGALNFYLPPAIRVLACEKVADDFHAIKGAKSKTYIYDAYAAQIESPFLTGRALCLPPVCDIGKMKKAAEVFVGTHDFTAFRALGSSATTTTRTVTECKIEDKALAGNINGLRLTISANGFLYKMVRMIMGSVIRVGQGKLTNEDLIGLLKDGKEWEHKVTADSYGLYLYKVEY